MSTAIILCRFVAVRYYSDMSLCVVGVNYDSASLLLELRIAKISLTEIFSHLESQKFVSAKQKKITFPQNETLAKFPCYLVNAFKW